jgi:hypothetical protein
MSFYRMDWPEAIARQEIVGPVEDLDPDIAMWPQTTVSRWPFSGPPSSGTWPLGWIGVDNTATMYVCVTPGSPGGWTVVGGAGGAFTTLQLNNPSVDNAVQINEILASGVPLLTNQQGVCYINSPIIPPPGLGMQGSTLPAKQGGPFAVPGLRIMAGNSWSPSIPSAAQLAYALPSSLDALVICAGISSWLNNVAVDGSTSPTVAAPAHQFPVALYNTDITLTGCLIRQSLVVAGAGAACCDIGDIGNSGGTVPLISITSTNAITNAQVQIGSDANHYLVLSFQNPLPAYMFGVTMGGATNLGTAQNLQMTLTGVSVSGGSGSLPPNPFLIGAAGATTVLPSLTNSQFAVGIANTITAVSFTSPTASVSFAGAARFSSYETDYESGTGLACQLGGVDSKIVGGRKLQGLFASSALGLDVSAMHFTGQGGTQTYLGNTGNWNVVLAGRGEISKGIFDTIPAGASGLIGFMVNDNNGNPFSFSGCEWHENTAGVTGFPVINRITTGGGTHGTNPINISGGIAYGSGPTNPAVFSALIDSTVSADMIEGFTAMSVNFTAATAAALFPAGTLPARYSVMFSNASSVGTYVHSP